MPDQELFIYPGKAEPIQFENRIFLEWMGHGGHLFRPVQFMAPNRSLAEPIQFENRTFLEWMGHASQQFRRLLFLAGSSTPDVHTLGPVPGAPTGGDYMPTYRRRKR